MKIHFYDTDPRKNTDPLYSTNMGSFGVVAAGFNKGLKEIGAYAEPDDADWVGICDGLNLGFKYKDKPSFILNVWDMINVLPEELVQIQGYHRPKMLGLSSQVTNLWRKYGVECNTVMPGCDSSFWEQSVSKNDKFTFLFNSFANVRSGLDLAITSFVMAFPPEESVRLIIKSTLNSDYIKTYIQGYRDLGYDIEYIDERYSFEKIRDLYSQSHCSLNVMRHSSWGLNIHEACACNTICIVGDFCPSNEIVTKQQALFISPNKEVEIPTVVPNLIKEWGLHNAYGNFTYRETPRFYSYDYQEYADIMKKVYLCRDYYAMTNTRSFVEKDWTWRKSAERLMEVLSD
jgi:hypothetical protein